MGTWPEALMRWHSHTAVSTMIIIVSINNVCTTKDSYATQCTWPLSTITEAAYIMARFASH